MWTLDVGQCCWTWITRKGEGTYGRYRNVLGRKPKT
jgi:hypothetical protein